MKRNLPVIILLLFAFTYSWGQQRYLSEVFTSYQKIKDSVYAKNFEVLTGAPVLKDLKCDIYLPPASDTAQARPLIIMLHTGNFLPKYINQSATGYKDDSATIEICKRLAMRGYVVCAPAYRQGWNPAGSTVDIRRGTIMNAVYRGMQDAKAAIRYMRKNAALYKIDENKVVIGGQGTGAYIAMGCAYVDRIAETRYSKFINSSTNQPYIDTALVADIDGITAGVINYVNNPTYSSKVNMIFNLGGAIGDINWMEKGEIPVVGFHSYTDPFAPDTSGMIYVPGTTPQPVIPADGNRNVCRTANTLGLNNDWKIASFKDAYSVASKINNEGIEGYYRFKIAPGGAQAAPWEWWDSTTTVAVGTPTYMAFGYSAAAAAAAATQCHTNGLLTNQLMSKTKAVAYIDTILNYLSPRMMVALKINGYMQFMGIEKSRGEVKFAVYPNPTRDIVNVKAESEIQHVTLTDISGREVLTLSNSQTDAVSFGKGTLAPGLYIIRIKTADGEAVQRLVIE